MGCVGRSAWRWWFPVCALLVACSSDGTGDDAAIDAAADVSVDGGGADASLDAIADQTIADVPVDQTTSDGSADTTISDAPDDASYDSTTFDVVVDVSGEAGLDGNAGDGGILVCAAVPACPTGMKYCNDVCVSIDDPFYGCTATGCTACASPSRVSSVSCSAGACTISRCYSGFADCDNDYANGCESDLHSPATCGSCTSSCGTSQVCDGNTCASSCTFPKTNCGGSCHDLSSDPSACGSCTGACGEQNGTATCSGGQCGITCDTGYSTCGTNSCSYNLDDGNVFCGNCTTTCGAASYGQTKSCSSGTCQTGCVPGFTSCNGQCVDENSDPSNCGGCNNTCGGGQACLDGACAATSSVQVITGLSVPNDIAVDGTNIYWTDTGTNEVWQANKVSFAMTKLASSQAKPYRIALDSQYVYWTSNLGGAILRAPIGSASYTVLYSANQPTAIALDATYVYWADTGTGQIYKAPKGGPDAGAPVVLTGSTSCEGVLSNPTACKPDEFKSDSGYLYAWDANAGVYRVDKGTGHVLTYVPPPQVGSVRGVAIDAANTYWMHQGGSQVSLLSVTKANSPVNGYSPWVPTNMPGDMLSDDCALYWTDGTTAIWKLPLALDHGWNWTVSPVKVTVAGGSPNQLAVDDTYVYWTDAGWIGRAQK